MTRKERLKAIYGFDDTYLLLVGIPVVSFVIPLLFFNGTLANGVAAYLPKWGVSLMYTCAYWFSCRPIFAYFRKRYKSYRQTRERITYTALGIIIMFLIWNRILDVVHHYFERPGHDNGVTQMDYNVGSFTILALVSTIYESIFFYYNWKKTIIQTEQLKRENVQSQLEGLKNQVNPHFLFNSLNTLTYIIPEDPDKAVKFVQKLSKVYRYILEIRDKKLISVEEEMSFLKSYIFLLKERFGDNLTIDINLPETIRRNHVVPLSLQILFENAIKHNIISREKPLSIQVFVKDDERLCIESTLQKKKQIIPSTKVGLQNIKNRYAYFTDEKVEITEADEIFSVCLPLIQMPEKVLADINS